ncbi:serine/threonine-protein kinase MRCK alpha-like isoform X2 [Clytia hemisphaerica]|uniref:serine/threonine-protein kinase MRCK alpha-like isoform X2 n=1 Tax=Clytia hemisphaerica TaxID=252671 RepID=UPI0034D50AD3
MENDYAEKRLRALERLYLSPNNIPREMFSAETLLDILIVLYDECNTTVMKRDKRVLDFLEVAKPVATRVKNLRLKREDFETLNVIGRGAFGEVAVVQMKATNQVFAMKTLNKWEMVKRAETACYREERDILVFGDKRWITKLHYAFQDSGNLYFVMDYYSGGDLLTLLSKYEDHLPESMMKFYVAEIILAINSIHEMNYVHRDIKPDNVLIDVNGHIKLADFGSCLQIGPDGYVKCSVAVGTPDYISPEILQAMEDGKGQYGKECDWWSLGICCYEMIYGETPFYAESLIETYGQIMDHKSKFKFPDDYEVSDSCKNLLSSLVCDADKRLGKRGLHDFKQHSFFNGIDWNNILDITPPYVPELDGPTDVSNFDIDDLMEAKTQEFSPPPSHNAFTGHQLPFVGFTYTKESQLSDLPENSIMRRDEPDGAPSKSSPVSDNAASLEKKIITLRKEKSELQKKLEDSLSRPRSREPSTSSDKSGAAELTVYKKKLSDVESKLKTSEKERKELDLARKTLEIQNEEFNSKVKELDRSKRLIMKDKDYLENEVTGLREKVSSLQKEAKENKGQEKQNMNEFSDLNDRLAEVRSQKMKLSRLVREKEEEIESAMNKLETSRKDYRTSEKKRHDLAVKLEEAQADQQREAKLRAKADLYCQQLEEELDTTKRPQPTARRESDSDVVKLRSEMDKIKVESEETLSREKKRMTMENNVLKEKLNQSEQTSSTLEQEVKELKDKMNKKMRESVEEENQVLADFKTATLRNKNALQKENDKLSQELETLTQQYERSVDSQRKLEEELRQLADKREAVSHWEEQIKEIIQWVTDEKDARGYLQALASKMSEELDGLKTVGFGGVGNAAAKNWQTRRSQRLDKQELLTLQANLKSEVEAKQNLNQELQKLKSQLNQSERRNDDGHKQLKALREELAKLRKENDQLKSGDGGLNFSFLNFFSSDDSPNLPDLPEEDSDAESEAPSRTSSISFSNRGNSINSQSLPVVDKPVLSNTVNNSSTPVATKVPEQKRSASITSIKDRQHTEAPPPERVIMHRYYPKTFTTPTKCHLCMSIMTGCSRQGVLCEDCSYHCHMRCINDAPMECPVPPQFLTNRPLGIDAKTGRGTAHESFIRVPKPGGVKRGWMRAYGVVCDYKILIYEASGERHANNNLICVLDMKDEEFQVSPALSSDVIHANKRDIPCIFTIKVAGLTSTSPVNNQLVLCDNEQERDKWVGMINELLQLYNKNHGVNRSNTYHSKSLCDTNNIQVFRSMTCAAVVNQDKVVVGTEDGLFSYELGKESITRIDDVKKVLQVEMIPEEQLLVVLSGKRHIRLYMLSVVEGSSFEPIKIPESKGALFFATGSIRLGSCTCLCVGLKKSAILYELNRTKSRHRKIREISFNFMVQWIGIHNNKLFVGHPSGFTISDISKENAPLQKLVSYDDPSLKFMATTQSEAMFAVEVSDDEYLLCFRDLAFYVNSNGKRSRQQEVTWPSPLQHIAFSKPYILAYSERGIDVFDVYTGTWLQTIQIPKAQPMCESGALTLISSPDQQSIAYLQKEDYQELVVQSHQGKRAVAAIYRLKNSKKRISFKTRESLKVEEADLVSKLISGPSNFSHVQHMGPGDGLQILHDIPRVDDKLAIPSALQELSNRTSSLRNPTDPRLRPVSSYQTGAAQLERDGRSPPRSRSMEFDDNLQRENVTS